MVFNLFSASPAISAVKVFTAKDTDDAEKNLTVCYL